MTLEAEGLIADWAGADGGGAGEGAVDETGGVTALFTSGATEFAGTGGVEGSGSGANSSVTGVSPCERATGALVSVAVVGADGTAVSVSTPAFDGEGVPGVAVGCSAPSTGLAEVVVETGGTAAATAGTGATPASGAIRKPAVAEAGSALSSLVMAEAVGTSPLVPSADSKVSSRPWKPDAPPFVGPWGAAGMAGAINESTACADMIQRGVSPKRG